MGNGIQYTVNFVNQSTNAGNVCLFQRDPEFGNSDVLSLAWFAKYVFPTTTVSFTWGMDYSFTWAETGILAPGVIFNASQSWSTDLETNNQVSFTMENGAYTFVDQTQGPQSGSMYIVESENVPLNEASVGIAMAGAGIFAVQAQPNLNLAFTPNPTYWITFGTYTAGQALDIEQVTNAEWIKFPPNVYSMTAILGEDGSWTIEPTPL